MSPAPQNLSLESRVVRKLNRRILPFAMLLYFVSFLDRVNVGFAAFTMNKAIGLSPAAFGFGGGIFFFGYLLFQVPSNLILYRVGARRWIAWVVVVWGVVSAATAFAVGPVSFCTLRFLLGAVEGGFFPGIILYLTMWFPGRHRALAVAAFMAAAPLSTAAGSPISGALMELPTFAGLSNWQWLFILEGLPAVLLGLLVLKVLADHPEQARWLAPEERNWLEATMQAEDTASSGHAEAGAGVWTSLRDPRVLVLSLIYIGTSAGLYAVGLWSPLILKQFGYSSFAIGWLNAIPGAVAIVTMILWARHSDQTLERTWHVAIPCALAFVGFVWAGDAQSMLAVILALTVVSFGVNAPKPPLWAMPSLFLSGAGMAAGIGWINSLGNVGGFVGPFLIGWMKGKWGSYAGGLDAVGAMMALSAVVMVGLSWWTGRAGRAASSTAD